MSERDEQGAEIWGDLWPLVKAHEEAEAAMFDAFKTLDSGDLLGRSMAWGVAKCLPKIADAAREAVNP